MSERITKINYSPSLGAPPISIPIGEPGVQILTSMPTDPANYENAIVVGKDGIGAIISNGQVVWALIDIEIQVSNKEDYDANPLYEKHFPIPSSPIWTGYNKYLGKYTGHIYVPYVLEYITGGSKAMDITAINTAAYLNRALPQFSAYIAPSSRVLEVNNLNITGLQWGREPRECADFLASLPVGATWAYGTSSANYNPNQGALRPLQIDRSLSRFMYENIDKYFFSTLIDLSFCKSVGRLFASNKFQHDSKLVGDYTTAEDWSYAFSHSYSSKFEFYNPPRLATSLRNAFEYSKVEEIDLSSWGIAHGAIFERFAQNCRSLKSVKFPINNITVGSLSYAFCYCSSLEEVDMSNVALLPNATANCLFQYCTVLERLKMPKFTSSPENLSYFFEGCQRLTELDLSGISTSNTKSFEWMFCGCYNLVTLNISNWDFSQYKYNSGIPKEVFNANLSLTNIIGPVYGIHFNLGMSASPLTHDSAMVLINGLATTTNNLTLSLSAQTYATLTEEEIAIATAKGWTVTSA